MADSELEPQYRVDGSCWKFVPVISEGFFNEEHEDANVLEHQFIILQLQLGVIFICCTIIHHIFFRPLKLPRLLSEVLTGLILGPSVFGRYYPNLYGIMFPIQSLKLLWTLTRFGYLFFMFLIGVKMDVNLIRKSGRREWIIGSTVIIIPLTVGINVSKAVAKYMDMIEEHDEMIAVEFLTGTLMLTSFPVVAILLMHLKLINSELGHLTLSSALISDLISVVIVNLSYFGTLTVLTSVTVALKSLFLVVLLIVFIVTVLRQMIYWIIRRTPEGKPVKDAYVHFVIIALFVVGVVGENVGLEYMYGPFILGLTIPTGQPLASTLIDKLDTFISGWMLPLVSYSCGFRSDLWLLSHRPPSWILAVVTVDSLLKTSCALIPALCFKMPLKDATALALMLTAKGIIELGTLVTTLDKKNTGPQDFTWGVMTTVIFATLVPMLTRQLYDPSKTYRGYQKRTVQNSSLNEAVRMLACARRQAEALSAIKLLQLSNPPIGTPLSVYGLYMEELVGGSSPVIIDHQLGQKSCRDGGRWQPVIDVFNYFGSHSSKPTQVQVYTAISPASLMYEDACWVAFANSVALIILPFHKKWNKKGHVISDSKDLRTFNTKVLHMAPCSVCILIDRDRARGSSIIDRSSMYKVCVVYLGGKDDREALAIARRMNGWPSVHLTVVRVKHADVSTDGGWEGMLDDECLRDIRHKTSGNGNLLYKEESVRHGEDTCDIIGGILDEDYDLIFVGRHSESKSPLIEGISDSIDIPELGPLGDMLASSLITKPVSVIVVQQQVIGKSVKLE